MSTFLNFSPVTESAQLEFDVPVYEGYVDPSGSGLMDILAEAAQDSYQLQAGLLIADIALEHTLVTEGLDQASILLEGVAGDITEKAKKNITALWSKFRAWFDSALQSLKAMFTTGEKFIEKFGKVIEEKDVKGFKYKGRKITVDAGGAKADKTKGAINAELNLIVKKVEDIQRHINTATNAASNESDIGDVKAIKDRILKASGAESIGDIKKEITLAYFNNEKEDKEISDFSENSKSELISIVKSASKAIAEVKKAKDETDKEFATVLKALNQAAKEIKGGENNEERGRAVVYLNKQIAAIKYTLTLQGTVSAARVDGLKATAKDAEKALKKYLSFNPKKAKEEAPKAEDKKPLALPVGESSSLLEHSMKLI